MQDAHVRVGNTEPTATVVWMGFESAGANPFTSEFLGRDDLAQEGALPLVRFLGGVDATNPSAETTIHAYSYSTRLATYALSAGPYGGGEVDHLVVYGSPGLAEPVRTVDDLVGVSPGEVYSTKSVGDQLTLPRPEIVQVQVYGFVMATSAASGQAGMAELGEALSDVGVDNADPNDPTFWGGHEPNVFVSDGVLGHAADKTPRSDGYWSRGADSIKDGARIAAGRGDEVR